MDLIVGYTGFVGSNICLSHTFDYYYNSRNIIESYDKRPDLCVYAGLRAEKFLANKDPEQDFDCILSAIENIKHISPRKLVLISTVDVYPVPFNVTENDIPDETLQPPYGKNRYYLEKWVMENLDDYHIIRLPGIFGANIKKNFIYDLINIIPPLLKEEKFYELSEKSRLIQDSYARQENGFFKCTVLSSSARAELRGVFERMGFSALNFTDSRSVFQYYKLSNLWRDIQLACENNIRLLNLAVEPIAANELYRAIKGTDFVNEITANIPYYNFKTLYESAYGGKDGYIYNKSETISQIVSFVKQQTEAL